MDRQDFLGKVTRLRGEGKSIRINAPEFRVHRTRVHRALNSIRSESSGGMDEHRGTSPEADCRIASS